MAISGVPGLELDHIVIAARSLEQGAAFVRERLGVDIPAGGKHPLMGTHNCLMRLGASAFLEVIAVDPSAERPARPRWYALDDPALRDRLSKSPQLIAWVLRSRTIERDALIAGYSADDIISVSRGTLSWKLTVPADGRLPWGGAFPHLIQWDGGARPWEQMADRDAGLARLQIRHPEADRLASILSRLIGNIPSYATITNAERPGLGAEIEVGGRIITL
jgi:hypothetical protein